MTKTSVYSPILIAGCGVLLLSFAIRAGFGVFQVPIASECGWPRSDFSLAIAIQNLAWGIGQPMFGAAAERFGDRKAIILGAVHYASGLVLSGYATTPGTMQLLEILVGFITAHFPAFITERCGAIDPTGALAAIGITSTSILGAIAISVIGLFNSVGSLSAGWLGKRYSKKYLLAGIYTGRTIASILFITLPMTPATVMLFSAVMGSMWLATVPLTSGLVAHLYGIRYMGTLYGFVFLSHQLGSFLGVWLGGRMYDLTGDYTLVWWIGIGVGAFSALIYLPIRESPAMLEPA